MGTLDLGANRYRGLRLGIDLLKPPALFPNMTGKSVRMVWTLDGPFATADYSYRLTSDFVQFDNNGFTGLHAEGRGRLTPVADARADPPRRQGNHRRRRCRRAQCSPTRKSKAGSRHAQARPRRRPQAHQRQVERQALAADRPRHRPLRRPAVGRDEALPDPRPRPRRRRHRPPRRARPEQQGQPCRRHRQGLGSPARQQLLPVLPAACRR